MARDSKPPDIEPGLKSWLDRVIIPALLCAYRAELASQQQPTPAANGKAAATPEAFRLEKPFYRPKEIGPMIGFSTTKVYQFIREKKLNAVNIEGSLRVPASAIQEFIDRYTGK